MAFARLVSCLAPALASVLALLPMAAGAQVARPTYEDLAPILAARCVICHAGPAAPLQLRLDSLEALLKGSQKGAVVKAGDAAGSELIRRLKGQSQPRMPMTGPPYLSDAEIALFERWVALGLERGGTGTAVPAPATASAAALPRLAPEDPVTYAQVAPIFATRCAKCHAVNGQMGAAPEGFVLTSYEATLASVERARVVPGSPAASELVRRIRGQARPRMPFDGPPYLAEAEIALITRWVEQGARNAQGQAAPVPVGAALRLHGSLDGQGRLDGLSLDANPGARRDKSPGPGDYVEVRGQVAPDGGVVPSRIRRRQ